MAVSSFPRKLAFGQAIWVIVLVVNERMAAHLHTVGLGQVHQHNLPRQNRSDLWPAAADQTLAAFSGVNRLKLARSNMGLYSTHH